MLEKQSQMHEHANCLEMLLKILSETDQLNQICPYSELLKVTPVKDEYFTWITQGKPSSLQSEQRPDVVLLKDNNHLDSGGAV